MLAASVEIQYFVAGLAHLVSFTTGTVYGWSSPVGLMLSSNNTDDTPLGTTISTSSEQFAWISSLHVIGLLISPFGASFVVDRIGRKWSLFITAVLFTIAYVLFIFSYHISILYIGRVVQGCGMGFVSTVQPLYIGEIASDSARGTLGTLMSVFVVAGMVYALIIGVYVSYYNLQYACLVAPVVFILLFVLIPESPVYLLAKGRKEEAIKSLQYLRRQPLDKLEDEIKVIEDFVKIGEERKGSFLAIIRDRANYKSFLICWGLMVIRQFSGIDAVNSNIQIILERANTGMDIQVVSIFIGLLQLIPTACSPILVRHFGRKRILLVSIVFVCIGLVCLGLYFYLDAINADTSSIFWFPLASFAIYLASNYMGFMPITFILVGEMFSVEIKSIACALINANEAVLTFILLRWYPAMRTIGEYFAFWLYSALCAAGFVFIYKFVCETKGLNLKQIQDKLKLK